MPTQGHMTQSVTRVSRVPTLAWGALAFAAIGCTTLDGPDQNAPTQQSVTGAPNAASVIALAPGPMFGTRTEMPDFIFREGTLGREGYCLCANEPRFISELLIGPIDPGSLGADIFLWRNPYKNIRSGNLVLAAVATVPGFTTAERSATAGFAETIQARDFLNVLGARDSSGI